MEPEHLKANGTGGCFGVGADADADTDADDSEDDEANDSRTIVAHKRRQSDGTFMRVLLGIIPVPMMLC